MFKNKHLLYRLVIMPLALILISAHAYGAETGKKDNPDVAALGAVVMEFETGRVLWEKDARKMLPMASTTKIMTAIIALENGNMPDTVTVSKRAAIAPKVKMDLSAGEEITLEGLLYALMLQSSNDAAVAIAEHIGGTVENFCYMMTSKARDIGALDTSYETPNGLDAEHHYSTAYDLALITQYALQNSTFVKIINTPSFHVSSNKRSYSIQNKNRFLNEYNGAFGVKTGFTGKAGNCFVGAAERNGMRLISVVLGSGWGTAGKERKWIDTKNIMNYAFGAFSLETLVAEGGSAGTAEVYRARVSEVPLYFKDKVVLPVSAEEKENIRITVSPNQNITAPVTKGDFAGVAKIYAGDKLLTEIDILAGQDIERHDLKTSIEKVIESFVKLGSRNSIEIILPEFQ